MSLSFKEIIQTQFHELLIHTWVIFWVKMLLKLNLCHNLTIYINNYHPCPFLKSGILNISWEQFINKYCVEKSWILDHISVLQKIYLFCTDSIRGFDHSINTRVDDGYHTSFYICDLFHHGFDLIYSVLLHTLHLLKNSIKVQRIKYHPLTWHVSRLHNEDMHMKLKLCDH